MRNSTIHIFIRYDQLAADIDNAIMRTNTASPFIIEEHIIMKDGGDIRLFVSLNNKLKYIDSWIRITELQSQDFHNDPEIEMMLKKETLRMFSLKGMKV